MAGVSGEGAQNSVGQLESVVSTTGLTDRTSFDDGLENGQKPEPEVAAPLPAPADADSQEHVSPQLVEFKAAADDTDQSRSAVGAVDAPAIPETDATGDEVVPTPVVEVSKPAEFSKPVQPRQTRAAASAAAKSMQAQVADEAAPQKQGGKNSAKKRKSPEANAEEAVTEGKQEDNAATTPLQDGETGDASAKPQANGSPKEKQSTPGRKGLASLFGSKGVMKNGSSRGKTSLSDLIVLNKPSAATAGPPKSFLNGLKESAEELASQVEKTDDKAQANGLLNGKAVSEANLAAEQPEQPAIDGGAPVEAAKPKRKGRAAGAKKDAPKASVTAAQSQRLRADGTPKRAYVRRKPVDKPAGVKAGGKTAPAVDASAAATLGQTASPKEPQTRKRTQTAAAQAGEGRGGRGRGRGRGKRGRGRGRWSTREDTPPSEPDISGKSDSETDFEMAQDDEEDERCDHLFGCAGCRWQPEGCAECMLQPPVMQRPQNVRWKPDKGRPQKDIPVAPTFFPTEEEFADPLSYINKIRPEGERAGVACIVPPKGWAPPFALDKGTNGQAAESFRFSIRKQPTWQLSMRKANAAGAKKPSRKSAAGRYDAKVPQVEDQSHVEAGPEDAEGDFGFVTLDRTHTLTSFEAYAKWAKALHFGLQYEKVSEGENVSGQLRRISPTVEEIEAEFWRIVETPEEVVESLYGQDLDSGHHGSGFPLPPSRKRLLEEHLKKTAAAAAAEGKPPANGRSEDSASEGSEIHEELRYNPEEAAYSEHCWNINNLPRCKGSVLRYVIGDELITGVMVPWLYVGSCMSAFCWHIEDHALYSINYLHKGAPKVWYGVPANASDALDDAMKDAFPHLFEAAPDLLYQLVTMLSPTQLKQRGVPVHRLVHHEGSFVITFPNAYHAGFNTGFNCAEAVNFAPPDWLPWGCSILNKYRRDGKAATLSNDALLIALVKGAEAVQSAANRRASLGPNNHPPAAETLQGGFSHQVDADRVASGQSASFSGRAAVPGQRADTSYLDPIKVEDAPAEAIRLAAAELSLRVNEERRRRGVGLGCISNLKYERMTGKPGCVNEAGLHTNTEDMDCLDCKCDLWMTAVISKSHSDRLFCPEHASSLKTPPEDWIVLYRYTLEELDDMLETAKHCVPGTREAIATAFERRLHPPRLDVKKLGPLASLITQSPISGSADPSPPPKRKKPAARPSRIKAESLKKEEAEASGEAKDREDSGELSDYPLSRAKRARRCKKEEEGDWIPPRKPARGPGRKRLVQDGATVSKSDDSEAETANVRQAGEVGAASKAAPEKADLLNGYSDKVKEAAESKESGPRTGAGRGRGRGRAGGRGRTTAGAGRGKGRGRGRGRGEVKKEALEELKLPELSPSAGQAVAPTLASRAFEQVPQTVVGQVIGLDNNQLALWSEIQRIMSQTSPKNLPLTTGLIPEGQQIHERLLALQGLLQRQGIQTELPHSSIWTPAPASALSPLSAAQQGSTSPRYQAGNSVLMDILRASVQAQPRGFVAPGSIPRSHSGGVPSLPQSLAAPPPLELNQPIPIFRPKVPEPKPQLPPPVLPEVTSQAPAPAEAQHEVEDGDSTEQSEDADTPMEEAEPMPQAPEKGVLAEAMPQTIESSSRQSTDAAPLEAPAEPESATNS